MNSEVTVTSSTADKRKHSEENGDDEPAQKILKASPENIKCIEDLCNILLDVRNKLNAVYQETGTKLKNSFESIQLFVPELKKDLSLPPMPIIAEPVQPEQPSQKLEPPPQKPEPPSQKPEPPSQKPEPPSKTKKPLPSLSDSVVSKWSLRHRRLEPGLVELMPGKGIFVSDEALARCQVYKTDMRKFARALLPEVFSKKAFEKCSFSGNGKDGKSRRGLDEYAREVFLEYVNKHAKEEGWEIVSRKLMFQALTDKVNSMRCRITGSRR